MKSNLVRFPDSPGREEFRRMDRALQLYVTAALIVGAAFLLWLGSLIGAWLDTVALPK
jgi:hypothetical protein